MSAALSIAVTRRALQSLRIVAAGCAAVAIVGLALDHRTTWGGYLVGFGLFTGLAAAGPLFLAIHNLSGARWSSRLVPIAEAMTRTLPAAGLLGIVLIGGVSSLYEWSHQDAVASDELLRHKSAWLNLPGYAIRMIVAFALWIWLGFRLIGASDTLGREARVKRSAVFMAVFAITFSLVAVDWFQSLEPHWFSTIYALLGLAGIGTSGLALVMITAVSLRRSGAPTGSDDELDDLGKLALSLSLFWAYIAFCQYMLIWYTNSPEETPWYEARRAGGWYALGVVNVALNWVIPFLVLMPRKCRRSASVIFRVAVVMIVGRVVDLFILIMPPLAGGGPRLSPFAAAPIAGALALFALVFLWALGVPAGERTSRERRAGRAERIPEISSPS